MGDGQQRLGLGFYWPPSRAVALAADGTVAEESGCGFGQGDMRSNFELQKLAEWWFDLSKITLGSMAIKFFEPGVWDYSVKSFSSLTAGLFLGLLFARLGTRFARMVER